MIKTASVLLLISALDISSSIPVLDTTNRIVNGFALDISEVPYQATLRRRVTGGWAHMCGAVIISAKSVVTAAHCVYYFESQPSELRVVVGTSNRISGGKSYDISRVYAHENYSTLTLENDIAVLMTSRSISFGTSVQPIAIAEEGFVLPPGTEALVSGFGVISYGGSAYIELQAAYVKIVVQNSCIGAYLRIGDITPGMICAIATDPPRDACQGDSGGPLVTMNTLIGIVSWGEGCANASYPGVYTRVSQYSSWINEKIASK